MKEAWQKHMAGDGSRVLGISIRAWIALACTATLCYNTIANNETKEPFNSTLLVVITFYFSQNGTNQKRQTNDNPTDTNTAFVTK